MTIAEITYEAPDGRAFRWTRPRLQIKNALERHGGEIRDRNGHASRILAQELGYAYDERGKRTVLNSVLRGLEDFGVIEIERPNARRMSLIRLVGYRATLRAVDEPDDDESEAQPDAASVGSDGPPVPPPAPAAVEGANVATVAPVPTGGPSSTPGDVDYGQLAVALMAEFMAALEDHEAATLRASLDAVKLRLGEALEERQRFARKLGEVADELAAVKRERDGLRAKLSQCETNLKAAVEGGSIIVDREVRERVSRFMREIPSSNASRSDN